MGGINRKLHVGDTAMINYLASFTNTDGASFPDTAAINATGPSATDGTEFVKLMVDDEWGARQALMNHAGLVPDGVTEADGTSQFLEALQLIGPGPGIGTEWLFDSDPAVTGHRCLLRQGQGILIASFPDLDAAVYVGDGNNATVHAGGGKFYRASDAAGTTPNIAGPYLILDDARGVVARGLDTAAAIDPDGASRFLGDIQVDAFQGHKHQTPSGLFSEDAETGLAAGAADRIIAGIGDTMTVVSDGVNGTPRDASETRMANRSTNFAIWY